MTTILFVLAAICFALDAFRVPAPVNWTPAGFCLLVLALFVL
jgi:hypothetical protein